MLSSICLKTPNQVGVDIEESLERILTTLYLGETTDRNLVQKWVSKTLLFVGMPSFSFSCTERSVVDEVFARLKETTHIKKIREIVYTNLSDELHLY